MFGIVSDEAFESQLGRLSEPRPAKVVDFNRGRGPAKEVPTELKKIISEEAIQGTPAKELSKAFGVSESSISAYKHDATSTATYNQPNDELKEHNDAIRTDILDKSRSKLLIALESITVDKLNDAKARDAAGIAKDMSAIIKNLEPETNRGGAGINQQFIFYAPKSKKETDFETIELKD